MVPGKIRVLVTEDVPYEKALSEPAKHAERIYRQRFKLFTIMRKLGITPTKGAVEILTLREAEKLYLHLTK